MPLPEHPAPATTAQPSGSRAKRPSSLGNWPHQRFAIKTTKGELREDMREMRDEYRCGIKSLNEKLDRLVESLLPARQSQGRPPCLLRQRPGVCLPWRVTTEGLAATDGFLPDVIPTLASVQDGAMTTSTNPLVGTAVAGGEAACPPGAGGRSSDGPPCRPGQRLVATGSGLGCSGLVPGRFPRRTTRDQGVRQEINGVRPCRPAGRPGKGISLP